MSTRYFHDVLLLLLPLVFYNTAYFTIAIYVCLVLCAGLAAFRRAALEYAARLVTERNEAARALVAVIEHLMEGKENDNVKDSLDRARASIS